MSQCAQADDAAEENCSGNFLFPSVLPAHSYTSSQADVKDSGQANVLSGFNSFKVEPGEKGTASVQPTDEGYRCNSDIASIEKRGLETYESEDSLESDNDFKEDKRKKRRKKDKKKNKHKKRKLKENEKSKILFDKTKPDTIWLDETNLKISDAFREDRREDKENIQFGTLYRLDVANYKRKNGIVCLGMKLSQPFEWNDGRSRKKKAKPKSADRRYFNTEKAHNEHEFSESNIDTSELSKSIEEYKKFRDHKSDDTVAENLDLTEDGKEGKIDSFSQRTEFFNEHLRVNPNDTTSWIEFAKMQDRSFATEDEDLLFTSFESERFPAGRQRAITEKKINILEKALSINRDSVELILEYMEYCREILDPAEVHKKWSQFTFNNPQSGLLWQNFLMYVQSNLSSFSVSKIHENYGKCFKTMIAIAEGAIKTHTPESSHVGNMLVIFVQYCLFLFLSDLTEKSVALMQAMIDFNCFVPKDIDNLPGSSQKPFFEAYWDSDVPRFGEQDAKGWNSWMLIQNGSAEDTESLVKCKITIIPLTLRNDSVIDEESVDLKLPKHANWLCIERNRELYQWKPVRQIMTEGDIEDPDRIVLADDILPCLFKLKSESDIQSLLLLHLSFIGVPICRRFFSEFLCDRIISRFLLPVRIKLFAGIDAEDFVCVNRTCKSERDDLLITLNDDRLHYIDDVFNQSLRLGRNYCSNFTNLISQCWLLFKIMLLKRLALGVNPHHAKTAVNGVRKFAKSLMKLESNRSCLELWQIFACFEYTFGQRGEAFRVFDMMLVMSAEEQQRKGAVFNKSAALFRNYVAFLMNASCQDVDQKGELENKIINILILLSGDISLPINPDSLTVKVNPLRLRRVKESFKERFAILLDDYTKSSKMASSVKASPLDELNFEWILCFALFMYFAEGFTSTESILREFQGNVTLARSQALSLSKLVLEVKRFRCCRQQLRVAEVRNELWSAMWRFPEESLFNEGLMQLENTGLASLKMRRFHHLNVSKSKSLISWTFAIHYEEERLKKLETLVSVEDVDIGMRLQDAVLTTLPNTGIVNRLRGLYNKATTSPEGRHCVELWRKFLRFEAKYGDARRTKNAFYAALQNCPWSKDLYTDAVQFIGDSLEDFIDIMHEKEVRIRLPIEELDILLEEAKTQVQTVKAEESGLSTARKSGNIILTYGKLFSSDTHQSIKRRIVTEKLTEIYTQMQLHVIGCV